MSTNALLETFPLEEDERRALCISLGYSPPDGHRRSAHHDHGFTDEDTEILGPDQPDAPLPNEVWLAVVDVLNVMK